MPAGIPLAGPAVNLVGDTQAACDEFMRDATGKVTLDREPLPLRKADGVPVRAGERDLVIEGSGSGFAVSVTYELTVSSQA